MDVHLDPQSEHLIEEQLRSGRYRSAEEVVARALQAFTERNDSEPTIDQKRAVEEMLSFAKKYKFTLGEGLTLRDLINEGRKY